MKITHINLKDVEKGTNPFYSAKWTDASTKEKAEIYSIMSKFSDSRVKIA